MWHKISLEDINTFPEEGLIVKVTDGDSIGEAYFVWSGVYHWIKFDYELDKAVKMSINPTHWMTEEEYLIFKRDEKIDQLICH